MKRISWLAGALALTAALAGCSSAEDDAALVVYSGRNEALIGPVFEQFTAATGIEVDVRYGDTPGMAAQLQEEGDRTPAAVFVAQDAGALGALADADLLATLGSDLTADVPAQYRATDDTWTGVTARARVIAYNPDLVAAQDVPQTVAELTDPKWSGKIALAPGNGSFQAFVTAMRVTEGEEATAQWLAGIAANDPQIYEKNGPILDAVDAGEVALGLINHYYWFEKAAEVGAENLTAQLAYTQAGDPGSLVNVSGAAILAGSADDADAQALITFLLSDQAQNYFAQETFEYPLVASVAAPAGVRPLSELQGPPIDLADLADLATTTEMIQAAGLL